MKDIIITITPLAQGFCWGSAVTFVLCCIVVGALLVYANKKKKAQATTLHGNSRLN